MKLNLLVKDLFKIQDFKYATINCINDKFCRLCTSSRSQCLKGDSTMNIKASLILRYELEDL